ncbi:hypothetical protein [Parasediminibacterium sp. JCM 36343]|uniref:hypothetical protein n=1 Tax=Parasediminibacterium sp. JCM 36343 TaxID=3374279 RepID=UPI00397C925B
MAKLKGIIKIHGTLDDLTFYKTQDGHLVKTKGGVSKERIATDANFQRTRENGSEFGSAASAGKLLRAAIRTLLMTTSDNRITSRVTQLMTIVKDYDGTSARGDRNVAIALNQAAAKAELKDFNFNIASPLSSTLFRAYTVNTTTGVITITGLTPTTDVSFPDGATHVSVRGAWVRIDFAGNKTEIQLTNTSNLPINGTSTNVVLTPAAVPTVVGTGLFLLAVEFFQQVNAVQYTLKNGAYNALSIIQVV